jgi:RNA polymerase-binding transcription factor
MFENLESVRDVLKSKMGEYFATPGLRDSIRIEQVSDPADITQQATDREIACQTLSRQAGTVQQLRSALERIDSGSYGVCMQCEEEISPKRLKAIPWAEFCIDCQEMADLSIAKMAINFNISERIGAA